MATASVRTIIHGLMAGACLVALAACDEKPANVRVLKPAELPAEAVEFFKDHGNGPFLVEDAPVWQYMKVNGGIPNTIVIEGDTGLIIVDTTLSRTDGDATLELIRQKSDKPIVGVIYTHHHIDHTGGAGAFVSREDAASGKVMVIAADDLPEELLDENAVTGPIMGLRAAYMYGVLLDPETDGKGYKVGLGGNIIPGPSAFIEPNHLIRDREDLTLDGVRMHIFRTGGEAASHIAVYLPDYGVMLSGDEIQGPTFPNLHSLRGTKPRDAQKWINAIDRMRAYHPRVLVPSHGPIVSGEAEVEKLLVTYRDAIQWTHDQAVRLINKGYTQEELAEAMPALPEHLTMIPWTLELYGTVKHSVRSFYTSYISWFDGDPATLDPTPRVEAARRTVSLMGGRDKVFAEAKRVFEAGDPQWSAELTTLLVRINREDTEARHLKAEALRQIGENTLNTNWRGFYLVGARELDGLVDSVALQEAGRARFNTDGLPSRRLLELMRYRLSPEAAADKHMKVGYVFPDRDEQFTIELRNQILDIRQGLEDGLKATMTVDRSTYDQIVKGETGFVEELASGNVTIDGSKLDMLAFLKCFDTSMEPIPIAAR
ncbi:alkyl sulfatase dimerization domain-containing protein [Pseudokordiimonas caeni]|uniref:alkyl sulfatase dimerization domain-containing protein n=1 Tax=Pseudokordiimonas caeni TaxID=2997908 RepID=UPI0028123A85|nr:alkyl sulfatase dimerization domain-containing protein [Pseudokordiimonas caeni]